MSKVGKLLEDVKLVAIARKVPVYSILNTAIALNNGGIKAIEVTFDQSSSTCNEDTFESIKNIKKNLGDKMCVGAGTVLNIDQVHAAFDAGADFILSPDTNIKVIEEVKRLGMISIPGAFTPSEIMSAWNAGADIVKLFPAGILGIPYYKAIRGPISHVPLMAVGGINENNVKEFLDAGFCSCGIGSNIVRNDLIAQERFEELEKLAISYIEKIK